MAIGMPVNMLTLVAIATGVLRTLPTVVLSAATSTMLLPIPIGISALASLTFMLISYQ